MRYRPQGIARLRPNLRAAIQDAFLFQSRATSVNIGRTAMPSGATSPILAADGVAVNSFNSAWTYPGGYSALPITVILDFRTVGPAIVSRQALWSSRSGTAGSGGLYFRYNDAGSIELLRSQVAQMASVAYSLPPRGGVVAFTYDGTNYKIAADGKIITSGSNSQSCAFDSPTVGAEGGAQSLGGDVSNAVFRSVFVHARVLSDAELIAATANLYDYVETSKRRLLFDVPAGGTNTPINPAVGALALTGYSPTIAQSVNQAFTPAVGSLTLTGYAPSVAQSSATAVNPGAGSLTLTGYAPTITQPQSVAPGSGALSITGFAPSVTQGITTAIAPGAGSLVFTGYAPAVTQSANQYAAPLAGALAITGYAPTLTQTANQAVLPAVGAVVIAGYAPTVTQAAASPSLTPGSGVLSITGYAPSVVQAAPVTKIGGDDVPREDDERIEIWEPRKPQPKRDDSLDKVVREAYAKATGKPIAAAVAKPGPSVRAPAPVAEPDPFDYDEDDLEVLLLSY